MSDKKYITRNELAKLAGCSPSAVSKAKREGRVFINEETGLYLAQHEINILFINAGSSQRRIIQAEILDIEDINPAAFQQGEIPEYIKELSLKKLEAEVRRIEASALKLELEVAAKKKDLVPRDLIGIWIGYFGSGIRNNFLTIPAKIARNNNIELRDRISKEIKKSIERTLDNAEKELLKFSKNWIKTLEAENED